MGHAFSYLYLFPNYLTLFKVPFCHFSRSYIQKPVRCVFQAYFHAYKSFNLKFSDLFFDKKKDFLDLQLNISEEFDNL